MFEYSIATLLALTAIALVWGFLKYKAGTSEKRMMQMLQKAGLDPGIATQVDTEAIISEVRRRCQRCQTEDVCERWLAGEVEGGNDFCPNAQVFEKLKQINTA